MVIFTTVKLLLSEGQQLKCEECLSWNSSLKYKIQSNWIPKPDKDKSSGGFFKMLNEVRKQLQPGFLVKVKMSGLGVLQIAHSLEIIH